MPDKNHPAAAAAPAEWKALPDRARLPSMLTPMLPVAMPGLVGGFVLGGAFGLWFAPPVMALAGAAIGAWIGLKHHRTSRPLPCSMSAGVRRAGLWQGVTRVPATRVQHLDLKRGPLQRHRNLATLVVHTAGTRHSAVTVPHLDADDAERLRDLLSRQIDADDDA